MKKSIVTTYAWLIKREFWENRAIWMVPSGIGIFLILVALFGHFPVADLSEPLSDRFIGGSALAGVGSLFFVTTVIYSSWYLLDCLYADRKDRSILFWKSLPISDTDTVLAKLVTAVLVIPLVYFVIADVTTLLVAFIVSVRYGSVLGRVLWHFDLWVQLQAVWLYLIATAALWFLPFSAWLLMVSAWSRRAVILWASLPPLALMVIEYKFFGTSLISQWLGEHTLGFLVTIFHGTADQAVWSTRVIGNDSLVIPNSIWALFDPRGFLSNPDLWVGLVVSAGLVYAAIQLRKRRAEV